MAEVPGPIAPDPVVTLDTVKGHPNPPGYRSDESFSDDEDDPDADVAKLARAKEESKKKAFLNYAGRVPDIWGVIIHPGGKVPERNNDFEECFPLTSITPGFRT